MYFMQFIDYEPKNPQLSEHYFNIFKQFNFIPEPGEEIRQCKRVPFWFVSSHGRCISVSKRKKGQIKPFRKNRDFYYKEPKEFGNRDTKVQHLVAEVFPDQVRIDPKMPIFSNPSDYELHHIIPFASDLGPYKNNHAGNLQWLYKPHHRHVTSIQNVKTKMERLTKKYGKKPITEPVYMAVPLDEIEVYAEQDGGISAVKNTVPKEKLKELIEKALENKTTRRILANIIRSENK